MASPLLCGALCVLGACERWSLSGEGGGAEAGLLSGGASGMGARDGSGGARAMGGGPIRNDGAGAAAVEGGTGGANGDGGRGGVGGIDRGGEPAQARGGSRAVGSNRGGSSGSSSSGSSSSGSSSSGGSNGSGGKSNSSSSGGSHSGGGSGRAGSIGAAAGRAGRGPDSGAAGASSGPPASAGLPTSADLLALMRKVIAYEIQLGPEDPSWVNKWTEATFYIGVMSAYFATHEPTFLSDATTWATKNRWTLLGSPTRNADNQCAGQVYEDLFLAQGNGADASMYANTQTSIDAMVADPRPGITKADGDDWWWCDALFMAPGAVSRLGAITGEKKYFEFLDTMWSATQSGLFDARTGLFWRDASFVQSNVYWSRGNGWVMGGVVRVLEHLPSSDSRYQAYVDLLNTMAGAIVAYQQSDGTWHSDLTHPSKYDNPEVSGTGLITYSIAYGIRHALLDSAVYLPFVLKAWSALESHVDPQGRVGYIQATGSGPASAMANETHDYGVGALILAASELYLMAK